MARTRIDWRTPGIYGEKALWEQAQEIYEATPGTTWVDVAEALSERLGRKIQGGSVQKIVKLALAAEEESEEEENVFSDGGEDEGGPNDLPLPVARLRRAHAPSPCTSLPRSGAGEGEDPRPAGGTGGGGERVGQEMIADGVMREATIGDLINGGEERAGFPTQKAREALAENGARTGVSVPRNDGREALGNGGTCVFELIRPGMHIRITNDDVLLQRGRLMQARGMIALAINAMGPLPRDDEIERLIELHDDQGPADQFGSFGGTE